MVIPQEQGDDHHMQSDRQNQDDVLQMQSKQSDFSQAGSQAGDILHHEPQPADGGVAKTSATQSNIIPGAPSPPQPGCSSCSDSEVNSPESLPTSNEDRSSIYPWKKLSLCQK